MSDYDSPFSYDYSTMRYMKNLELVFLGKADPNSYNDKHLSRSELVERDKSTMLRRMQGCISGAAGIFSGYRNASDSDLKAAKRQFQKVFDEIPPNFDDQVFALWRIYIKDALDVINAELDERGMSSANGFSQARENIRKIDEIITKLDRDCREEINKNPHQAALIKKIYWHVIDRIREHF